MQQIPCPSGQAGFASLSADDEESIPGLADTCDIELKKKPAVNPTGFCLFRVSNYRLM